MWFYYSTIHFANLVIIASHVHTIMGSAPAIGLPRLLLPLLLKRWGIAETVERVWPLETHLEKCSSSASCLTCARALLICKVHCTEVVTFVASSLSCAPFSCAWSSLSAALFCLLKSFLFPLHPRLLSSDRYHTFWSSGVSASLRTHARSLLTSTLHLFCSVVSAVALLFLCLSRCCCSLESIQGVDLPHRLGIGDN